jgi:hypothetical protein
MKRAALLLALAACGGKQDPTEIVVEVRSDLNVPAQMDELRVRVATGPDAHFDERYPLGSGPNQLELPKRVTLVPDGAGTPTVTLEVSALQGGREVVSRRAVLAFVPHQSLYLRIDLLGACWQHPCVAGSTCVAGACVGDSVDPSALPRFTPSQPLEPLPPAPDAAADGSALDAPADGLVDRAADAADDGLPPPPDVLKTSGAACATSSECASGICADSVCCATTCAGPCHACNVEGRAGSCQPVPAGQDPHAACDDEGPVRCGRDGMCDGAGACRLYERGTLCAPPACAGDSVLPARTCDGAGTCTDSFPVPCAPFVCRAGACVKSCAGPGDCAAPLVCVNAACVAATEDCNNGVDDDGDGNVDCADSDCGNFACAPSAPPGWNGPVSFVEGKDTLPSCQAPYATVAYQGKTGLTCASAVCTGCFCASPQGVVCGVPALTWSALGCLGNNPGRTSTGCERAGQIDSGHVDIGPAGPASGGRCLPSGGMPVTAAPSWGLAAQACAPKGLIQGGCGASEICAPRPGSPFESRLCVFAPGVNPCPPGYDHDRRVYYAGASDSRGCSACTCGDPQGVACGGRVNLYPDPSCPEDRAVSVPVGTTCFNADKNTQATRYVPSISGGSCQRGGGDPVGGCQPAGATTVCCAQ